MRGYSLARDVAEDAAVVFGVGRSGQGQRFLGRIGSEELLPGDAYVPSTVRRVDGSRVRLKPRRIPVGTGSLRLSSRQLLGIGYLPHHQPGPGLVHSVAHPPRSGSSRETPNVPSRRL